MATRARKRIATFARLSLATVTLCSAITLVRQSLPSERLQPQLPSPSGATARLNGGGNSINRGLNHANNSSLLLENGSPLPNQTCIREHNGDPPHLWQKRAPLGIILGPMKGGTQALSSYLNQHPNITKTRGHDGELVWKGSLCCTFCTLYIVLVLNTFSKLDR